MTTKRAAIVLVVLLALLVPIVAQAQTGCTVTVDDGRIIVSSACVVVTATPATQPTLQPTVAPSVTPNTMIHPSSRSARSASTSSAHARQ
jgi:hypothetical protein